MNRPALSERSESKGESKGPLRWSASGIPWASNRRRSFLHVIAAACLARPVLS
jgi:hypothetical protein